MDNTEHYRFHACTLPYSHDALEPYLSEETVRRHHELVCNRYVEQLNAILKNYPQYQDWTLEQLIRDNDQIVAEIREQVLYNAGGLHNHIIYFEGMRPAGEGEPRPIGTLKDEIDANFGSFEEFKRRFKFAAGIIRGAGFAGLVKNHRNSLCIITMRNNESPLAINLYPVLILDVWEHAYMYQYLSREEYIENWFNLIDWQNAEEQYLYEYDFRTQRQHTPCC